MYLYLYVCTNARALNAACVLSAACGVRHAACSVRVACRAWLLLHVCAALQPSNQPSQAWNLSVVRSGDHAAALRTPPPKRQRVADGNVDRSGEKQPGPARHPNTILPSGVLRLGFQYVGLGRCDKRGINGTGAPYVVCYRTYQDAYLARQRGRVTYLACHSV